MTSLACPTCGGHVAKPTAGWGMTLEEATFCPHPCHALAREVVDAAVAGSEGYGPKSIATRLAVRALLASLEGTKPGPGLGKDDHGNETAST